MCCAVIRLSKVENSDALGLAMVQKQTLSYSVGGSVNQCTLSRRQLGNNYEN